MDKSGGKESTLVRRYSECIRERSILAEKGRSGKLCPEGYCTAKMKFKVYPSAYANGYGVQVCQGTKPTMDGRPLPLTLDQRVYIGGRSSSHRPKTKKNGRSRSSSSRRSSHKSIRSSQRDKPGKRDSKKARSDLKRWFAEKWVNVCERGNGPGGVSRCGRKEATDLSVDYPYCRPYYRFPGTKSATVTELDSGQINAMCARKRKAVRDSKNRLGGVQPTRVFLKDLDKASDEGRVASIGREMKRKSLASGKKRKSRTRNRNRNRK